MIMSNQYQTAGTIRGYVGKRVLALQKAYLAGASSARGTLARLRRLDTPGGGSWMVVGEELLADLPDLGLGMLDQERLMRCAKASLRFYAIHQQSKQRPMAVVPSEDDPRRGSFGSACHAIAWGDDGEGAAGVRRRMALVEAAGGIEGVEACMRQLVLLMRAKDVQLDYGRLAHDLYLLQFDWARDGIFMEWALDYYAPKDRLEQAANPGSGKATNKDGHV